MNAKRKLVTLFTTVLLLLALTVSAGQAQGLGPAAPPAVEAALGTAFTYQGYLRTANGPVTGACDFQLSLWDSLNNSTGQIGTTQAKPSVGVSNGMFTIPDLDFGPGAFNGGARWLQIAVKCGGDSVYSTLAPRQALTPAPYAMYAPNSGSATALQGNPVANTAPTSNQVLKWNGTAWSPAVDETGAGGGGDITAVIAGTGLDGGATSGDATLNVTFAGTGAAVTVSRSDHQHDAAYVNDNAGEVGDPDVPAGALSPDRISGIAWTSTNDGPGTGLDADLLDGQHATGFASSSHNHWGQTWTGSGTGLTLSGGTTGVSGAGSTYGLYGTSSAAAGYGVYATAPYVGVSGISTAASGGSWGVYGRSDSSSGYGVRGNNTATSGTTYGVYGTNASTAGSGVYGSATGSSGTNYGVNGLSSSASGYGGYFANNGLGVGMAAVMQGYSPADNPGWWLPAGLFSGRNGVIGMTKDPVGVGVVAHCLATSGAPCRGLDARTESADGWAGRFTSGNGNGVSISVPAGKAGLTVSGGSKNAVVATRSGSRLLYSEESTQVWFTDYGFGKLENGQAIVTIDPIFAQTVNLTKAYHVFVQAYGDADLFVVNRTPGQFEVRARDGDPNVDFSYRIVAERLGYEGQRLEAAPWADNDPNLYPDRQDASTARTKMINGVTAP